MERDVTGWLHKGETVPNLVAGLAYSIALNYLNRVVRGRKIGNVIYFQGGTAYNDAVTAAFASLLGKKITVPPYNGVMGAIGMALIARQWHQATGGATPLPRLRPAQAGTRNPRFRLQGLLEPLRHEGIHHRGAEELLGRQVLRQVPQAFRHRPQAGDRRPVRLPRAVARERCRMPALAGRCCSVGLPRAMSMLDQLPFWRALFRRAGHPDRAFAGDRPAHFRRGNRYGRGAALLPGAGGARPRAGAGGSGRGLHPGSQHGGCRYRRRTSGPRTIARGTRRCRGCCAPRRRSNRTAPLPDSHAAFPARARAGEEGAGRNHAPHRRHAARERPRGGCRLRRAARLPGQAARSRPPRAGDAGTKPASRAWCWPGAATTSTTAA